MSLVDDVLAHYGVGGMRWGFRKNTSKSESDDNSVTVTSKAGKGVVKTEGGKKQPASEDAKKVAATRQLAKSSTLDALSNKDMNAVITRMNLEKNYMKLNPQKGVKAWVKNLMMTQGKAEVIGLATGNKGPVIKYLDMVLAPQTGGARKLAVNPKSLKVLNPLPTGGKRKLGMPSTYKKKP